MSNMTVSDIIHIMQAIEQKYGNIDVVGECEDCGANEADIYILTADKPIGENHTLKCWIMVSSPN